MRPLLACCLAVAASLLSGCNDDATSTDAGSRDRGPLFTEDDLATPAGDLAPARCGDGLQDDDESDVDCGGSCPGCADTRRCLSDADWS